MRGGELFMGNLVVCNGMGEGGQLMLVHLRMHSVVNEPVCWNFALFVVTVSDL